MQFLKIIVFSFCCFFLGLVVGMTISHGDEYDSLCNDCEMNAYELRALEIIDRYEFQKGRDIYEPGWSPGIEPLDMPRIVTPYFMDD
jgi:hypothetical protein